MCLIDCIHTHTVTWSRWAEQTERHQKSESLWPRQILAPGPPQPPCCLLESNQTTSCVTLCCCVSTFTPKYRLTWALITHWGVVLLSCLHSLFVWCEMWRMAPQRWNFNRHKKQTADCLDTISHSAFYLFSDKLVKQRLLCEHTKNYSSHENVPAQQHLLSSISIIFTNTPF